VSARVISPRSPYLFAFRCDDCERPEVVSEFVPAGWEVMRAADGKLQHTCSGCWFERLVEGLEEALRS
jgi:hypothetical protein